MAEPILIVHGVANHESTSFLQSVDELKEHLGQQWELIPVFWGDLGGVSDDINDCLPILKDKWGVRSESLSEEVTLTRAEVGGGQIPEEVRINLIAAAASPYQGETVRSESDSSENDMVVDAIREELPNTKVLQYIDDPAILQSLGETIRGVVEATADAGSYTSPEAPKYEVRSSQGSEVRGFVDPLFNAVKTVIRSVDDMLGRFLGDRLGQVNQTIRGSVAGSFAGFCGDILVYQRNQLKIQKRIWDALEKHGQGYGTREKPVHAIAHSLGGVIVFDTAVEPNPEGKQLWLKSFTTFGSQAAFFHIIDPRPSLTKYRHNEPVPLPSTIGRWVNLWDTFDFLAFTAGTVFLLHDNSKPVDIAVQTSLSEFAGERGWTHSVYWKSEELKNALKIALS